MRYKLFLSIGIMASLSGCSFLSFPPASEVEPSAPLALNGQKIENILRTSDKPIITQTKNGGKKYVIKQTNLPVPPMPCTPSKYDKFPLCMTDFGIDGEIRTNIYYVDANGFIYDTDFTWKTLPANEPESYINYNRDPKPDADSQLDFKII